MSPTTGKTNLMVPTSFQAAKMSLEQFKQQAQVMYMSL